LFMRLLFLEKDLSDHLGVDAFVLIDTEGLGAPEKMNEPESEKKDRMLATFAMGISNLTILNVLGESTRDLTEILQIAIVTIARLEEAGMAPNIRMVQHVSERNMSKFSEPEEKFREALHEALTIANEKDTAVGISSMKCLQILDERIKKGQLLKQFRPFKNGATAHAPPSGQYHEDVVDLYNSILDDCKNSLERIEFTKWGSLIQGYWRAVSHEGFAVRFRNIKEIYDFIYLGERIAKVKETINEAFFQHEEQIMQKFRTELLKWSHDHKTNSDLKNKCSEFLKKDLSSECLEIINKAREQIMNEMKDNAMSDGVRKEKVEDIWMLLREYISSNYKIRPVTEQIDEEVKDVFNNMGSLFNKYKEGTLPNLSKCKAYMVFISIGTFSVDRCPAKKDADKLEKALDDLADVVLEKKNARHFYSGI
ncbi:18900_t:CDS:2, partial [Racocetra fulgida]